MISSLKLLMNFGLILYTCVSFELEYYEGWCRIENCWNLERLVRVPLVMLRPALCFLLWFIFVIILLDCFENRFTLRSSMVESKRFSSIGEESSKVGILSFLFLFFLLGLWNSSRVSISKLLSVYLLSCCLFFCSIYVVFSFTYSRSIS